MCSLIFLPNTIDYLKLFSLSPPRLPVTLLPLPHLSGQTVCYGRRLRRHAPYKRFRSAQISISGVTYCRNMFGYSSVSIQAILEHVHISSGRFVGGPDWGMLFSGFAPSSTPRKVLMSLAAQIGMCPYVQPSRLPPAERPNKNELFPHFFTRIHRSNKIAEDENIIRRNNKRK